MKYTYFVKIGLTRNGKEILIILHASSLHSLTSRLSPGHPERSLTLVQALCLVTVPWPQVTLQLPYGNQGLQPARERVSECSTVYLFHIR